MPTRNPPRPTLPQLPPPPPPAGAAVQSERNWKVISVPRKSHVYVHSPPSPLSSLPPPLPGLHPASAAPCTRLPPHVSLQEPDAAHRQPSTRRRHTPAPAPARPALPLHKGRPSTAALKPRDTHTHVQVNNHPCPLTGGAGGGEGREAARGRKGVRPTSRDHDSPRPLCNARRVPAVTNRAAAWGGGTTTTPNTS